MKGESPSPPRPRGFRHGWVLGLLGVSGVLRLLFPDGEIFSPPYCAWRFIGNGDAWNIAYPDAKSIYHVMQLRIGEHDVFKIVGESFPYARYMSYQTYDIPKFMSQMSLRDVDIVPDFGINAYNNLTAAVLGEKQGGYTIYITPHGDQNYTNELRALPSIWKKGHFDLFFRIYMEDGPAPPQAPWSHLPAGGELDADKWGWVPPPRLYVLRRKPGWKPPAQEGEDGQNDSSKTAGQQQQQQVTEQTTPLQIRRPQVEEEEWREIPMCKYRRRTGFKWVAYLAELARPALGFTEDYAPNKHNNVFLPKYSDRMGKFASKDANYIAALVDTSTPGQRTYARITGKWPRTAGSLYQPPYVANYSDYHVRYASLSSGSRNPPFMNFGTVSDSALIRHFTQRAEERGTTWDGSFVVWLVPPEIEDLPEQITRDQGMVLKWGRDPWTGRSVYSPGVLYRQVMAQSQVLPKQEDDEQAPHPSGINNIVPEFCDSGAKRRAAATAAGESKGGDKRSCRQRGEDPYQGSCPSEETQKQALGSTMEGGRASMVFSNTTLEAMCCGWGKAPSECFTPNYLQYRMGDYYPRIEYFISSDDDPTHTLTRRGDSRAASSPSP